MNYNKNENQPQTGGKGVINLNSPVGRYPEEVIKKGLVHLKGNSPLENIINIKTAMLYMVMGCDDIDDETKKGYICLFDYLEFQFEILKEVM
jgi:hypothetical protein